MVTSLQAAYSGSPGIYVGNVVGSNIANILGILGVTAIVKPIPVPPQIAHLDIWVMIGATAMLFAVTVSRWNIGRIEGAAMLAAYAAYSGWLAMNASAA
ncbi:hypothetical protein [Hyphomonas sp.]|uniref:hypothetical protein n=1 Tax=Hyphomonas sp. TaxID=87 RepID=UPI003527EDAC